MEYWLETAGVSHRHVKTEALSLAISTISSISDLIAAAECRRDKAIKKLEDRRRYKAAMSRGLPAAAKDVIDVKASDEPPRRQNEDTEKLDQTDVTEAATQPDDGPEEDGGT